MTTWPLHDAKARLSEVIERARTDGPQTITRHGADHTVVPSIEDFRTLTALDPDFREFLLGGPKTDDFGVERDPSIDRAVEF